MTVSAGLSLRVRRVDALKGFAIVCVVLYHAAGQYFTYSPATGVIYDTWALWVRALLFSFMLPLFAFLSGYVLGRPGGFRPRDYFVRRTLGLLVPYVAWETIYGPWRDKHPEMLASVGQFVAYYTHIFTDPHYEGRMWYLYVLWIALMILGAMRLPGDRTWVILGSVPVVWVLGSFGQFHWLRWVYLFVVVGLLWRRYEAHIRPRVAVLGVLGGAGFAALWWLGEPEQIAYARLAGWFGAQGSEVLVQVYPMLTALTGLCAVAALVWASYHVPQRLESGLAYLGMLSLGIYVTHFRFVEIWRGVPAWSLPVIAAVALAIAVGVTLLLGKWRVTATVLLGEPWTSKTRAFGDVHTETL